MLKNDGVRLRHMLDAAHEAVSFLKGKSKSVLLSDRVTTLALTRSVEIIGEAASAVTQEFRNQHPTIPWAQIVGMRNRLIHAYFDVDIDRVWDTVASDLPPLIEELEKMLKE